MTIEDVISVEMACERSVRDIKMSRSSVMESLMNNNGSAEDGKEVPQKEERDCVQELLRKSSVLTWPAFLENLWNCAEYKD